MPHVPDEFDGVDERGEPRHDADRPDPARVVEQVRVALGGVTTTSQNRNNG